MFPVRLSQRVWRWLVSHGYKALVPALLVLVSACGGGGGGDAPTLTAITVTPASTSVAVANARQFTAIGTYSDGSTADITSSVTWTSTHPSVATITATGLATGVAAGTTMIAAASGAVSGGETLTVTGEGFPRFQLLDLNVPRTSALDVTVQVVPEGAPQDVSSICTHHLVPSVYALTKSGKILLSGKVLGDIDYEKQRSQDPCYWSTLNIYGRTSPDGSLTRWSNTVQYNRTFIYEAGEFRDLGVPSGIHSDFESFAADLARAYPAPYLSFKATIISPNGGFVFGTSWNDRIESFIGLRADFGGSGISSTMLPLSLQGKDTQFIYSGGGFTQRADRHERVAAINDVGQTCGNVRRLEAADPPDMPEGASINGKVIGPGACVAINNAGHAVGDTGASAFVYADGVVKLLDLGGGRGVAYDINNFGDVVGESTTPSGETHAFFYTKGRMSDLGVIVGGTYSSARYVNDTGEIVGYAKDPLGVQTLVIFRDGKAIDIVSRIADEADRAPFNALHGLDKDGNVLVSKPFTIFDNNVFLLERLK